MKLSFLLTWTIAAAPVLLCPLSAFAESELDQMCKELNEMRGLMRAQAEEIRELREQVSSATAQLPPAGSIGDKIKPFRAPVTADEQRMVTLYDDGFVFKGADDLLRVGGWAQADFRLRR